jgi:pentafunctional AROM polypeptide
MADQTDCFMTLAAIAALSSGLTTITGIANQRVKECDRIHAMAVELEKCGIHAEELPDGLIVHGIGFTGSEPSPLRACTVHCYDDHRIAMSMALLSYAYSTLGRPDAIILDDSSCVEKTYPEYWDHLEAMSGCTVLPATPDTAGHGASKAIAGTQQSGLPPKIVFIGMRGAGKSTLAAAAARVLAPFGRVATFDLDRELEKGYDQSRVGGAVDAALQAATVSDIVKAEGWDGFRHLESQVLQRFLDPKTSTDGTCSIIACGGGVVEAEGNRKLLCDFRSSGGIVIEVVRDIEDIVLDLFGPISSASDSGRPAYPGGETIEDVYRRRQPWYTTCSTYSYMIPKGCRDWVGAIQDQFSVWLLRIVSPCLLQPTPSLLKHANDIPSTFLCMSIPDIHDLVPSSSDTHLVIPPMEAIASELRRMTPGSSGIELRVDLMHSPQDEAYISNQLALYRHCLHASAASLSEENDGWKPLPHISHTPIIWTVRTTREGGKFPLDIEAYARVVRVGLRYGIDCVDLELGRPASDQATETTLHQLVQEAKQAGVRIIASAHWPGCHAPISGTEVEAAIASIVRICGPIVPSAIKLIASASSPFSMADWHATQYAATRAIHSKYGSTPSTNTRIIPELIMLVMGEAGKLTRILNNALTPVTHAAFPVPAAPGQLSLRQIVEFRSQLGMLAPQTFSLFGSPIGKSASPVMHNAVFTAVGLPHDYVKTEVSSVDDAIAVMTSIRGFGGGSVTIPLKQDILPHCTAVSEAARRLGAVNTLLPIGDAHMANTSSADMKLWGSNTDWIGIRNPLFRRLAAIPGSGKPPSAGTEAGRQYGLVIGAGGTAPSACFAIQQLGLIPVIHNPRTPARGAALAETFGPNAISLPDLSIAALEACGLQSNSIALIISTLPASVGWTCPDTLLSRHPIVMDVVYCPRMTPLLTAAEKAGCSIIAGIEMLIEQAIQQAALFTGLARAPSLSSAVDLYIQHAGEERTTGIPTAAMASAAYTYLATLEADGK